MRQDRTADADADIGIGAAIDLGTTEIRVSLWDRAPQRRIGEGSVPNPQNKFGTDVLSRLAQAARSPERAHEISGLASKAIAEGLSDVCSRNGVPVSAVGEVAIVGNTAMLALLTGHGYEELLEPEAWDRTIECRFEHPGSACASFGLDAGCRLLVVQPIAGFVGSDLLAGVIATRLEDGPAGSLLIDFGANTEIALWDGMRLWGTSAAGGPAFECCGIHSGMPARPGAIWRVACASPPSVGFELGVIGGGRPEGICGSGFVGAVACMIESGLLTTAGRLTGGASGGLSVALSEPEGIVVTRPDIDTLMRAKAGVAAAVQYLLALADVAVSDIQRVCVSGMFGGHLDVTNAQSIGLLPPVASGTVELCGNTALTGCEAILREGQDVGSRERRDLTVVNMSYLPEYENVFVSNLFLTPWESSPAYSLVEGNAHAR